MNLGTGLSQRPGTDPDGGAGPGGTGPAGTKPGKAAPATGWRAQLEANKRAAVLLAAVLPLAAAGAAYLLLFSGGDPAVDGAAPAPATGTSAPAPTPTEAGTAGPSGTATGGATGSAGSSRNPFAPKPSASASTSGSQSASTSDPATTVTATVTDPAVYLTLFSIDADGAAKFSVNGTGYTQNPGDTFGEGKALTYHKKVTVSGTTCASVSYNDQTDTVCPGEMHQVG